MIFLYPTLLWLLIPLVVWWIQGSKAIEMRIHLLILMLLVLALSRPVQEATLQKVDIDSKNIIIALDVSYSMQATDIKPTRYAFAKEMIHAFLKTSPSDNIMLIAFTTNPLLLSPPTTDHPLISMALKTLNPAYILTKGTSLENLFKKIATLQGGHKNLILITDGGEEQNPQKLLALLEQANVSLITLAMGTTQGTTLTTSKNTLLKDKKGNLVVSRINPLLKTLTQGSHGSYFEATNNAEKTASQLYHALSQQNHTLQYSHKIQRQYKEWYQVPLFLAVILFLMLHTRMVKYLLLLSVFMGMPLHASFLDTYYLHQAYAHYQSQEYNASLGLLKHIHTPSLQSHMAQANSYYKNGNYTQAITLYKSIQTTSVRTKQQIYYNMANAYAKLASYTKAKSYYTKVLQLGEDPDTLYNLKYIALRQEKETASLGIAHPKSQSDASHKSENTTQEDKETDSEDQPSSGSGAGGEKHAKKQKPKNQLLEDTSIPMKHPLSSKVYELINKGYIRETHPW